jgi:hypothetical protein
VFLCIEKPTLAKYILRGAWRVGDDLLMGRRRDEECNCLVIASVRFFFLGKMCGLDSRIEKTMELTKLE